MEHKNTFIPSYKGQLLCFSVIIVRIYIEQQVQENASLSLFKSTLAKNKRPAQIVEFRPQSQWAKRWDQVEHQKTGSDIGAAFPRWDR